MENHSYSDIIGSPQATYIKSLAGRGALFTQSFAVTHPSEPNYLALFSGSTQGVTSDACPLQLSGTNLATELASAGGTFAGYSEGLPSTGDPVCSSGKYARKHAPWASFSSLPGTVNQPFTAFPVDFATLPTVSFVIPDLDHDMHDGSVATGDAWLAQHLDRYASWAEGHNGLLVLTFDEDDRSQNNQIATVIVGAHVRVGRYDEHLDHYRLLRTLEALTGLDASQPHPAEPLTDLWSP
jgi:acid phosphatase